MSERTVDLPVSQMLPGRLLHAALRDDTIAYLQAAPLTSTQKRKLFRRWCTFTMSSCRREDLDRVAPRGPKARNGELF